MSKPETVGVVIPTYNSARTIERALDSVHRQTLRPNHVVVVDNGSSDNTTSIVERFAAAFPHLNIELRRLESNHGPGHARNIGWDICRTTLIAFLDSDDAWHPQKLQIQLDIVMRHPTVVLFGHRYQIATDGITPLHQTLVEESLTRRYSLRHFLLRNRLSTPTVMIRRDLPYRFPQDVWFAEDFALWTRVVAERGPAVVSDAVLTYLFKPAYGADGLSARLVEMHQGELTALKHLRSAHHISAPVHTLVSAWMRIKYLRRKLQVTRRD